MRLNKIVTAVAAAIGITLSPIAAHADVGPPPTTFTITATGVSNPLILGGAASCNFTTSGSSAGLSTTIQVASDQFATWSTSGIAAPITANGIVGGSLATAAIPVPYAFRFNTTAITSGTATIVVVCGGSSGGGGGSTTLSTFLPTTTPTNFFQNCSPCSTGAAGALQIVPINGTKTTYMLWLTVNVSIAETITLEYGTQSTNPCDTGTTVLGPFSVVPGIGISLGFHTIPSAKQYCFVSSAVGNVAVMGAGYQQ